MAEIKKKLAELEADAAFAEAFAATADERSAVELLHRHGVDITEKDLAAFSLPVNVELREDQLEGVGGGSAVTAFLYAMLSSRQRRHE